MRIFEIALMIALFTAVSGVINDIGFLGEHEAPIDQYEFQTGDFNKITGELTGNDDALLGSDTKFGVTAVLAAIDKLGSYVLIRTIIINTFATHLEPGTIEHNQIVSIANLVQTGCGFLYFFGILQLWRKVSTKHME